MSKAVHSIAKEGDGVSHGGGDFSVDDAVLQALPAGSKVVSSTRHGFSDWTVTARLDVILLEGVQKSFFLKTATDESGRVMLEGEYNSMKALYETSPEFVPKPHTWGKFETAVPKTYFFLCDFIDMTNNMPDPAQFGTKLAKLHSLSKSPTGMFGFHIPTCHGRFAQETTWNSSWTSFFTKLLQSALAIEKQECSPWPEYEAISERILSHVIPRLLGALEEGDRKINPSLIHGDLWEGNVGTDLSNNNIYIFDAGAYYAHDEMEIGMWRCERHKFSKLPEYKKQYLQIMGRSEPVDEFDDRNRLYCVKMNVIHSAHHPGCIERKTAYDDMCYLVDKYAPYLHEEEPPRSKAYLGRV